MDEKNVEKEKDEKTEIDEVDQIFSFLNTANNE